MVFQQTYIYSGVRPKLMIRTVVFGLFFLSVACILFDLSWWLAVAIVVVGHLIYFLITLGSVRIVSKNEAAEVHISSLWQSMLLHTPLKFVAWWNYVFNEQERKGSSRSMSRTNDLRVYLLLSDREGNVCCFAEHIAFDTRFPNELPFANRDSPNVPTVIVQRVDWVIAFLQEYLEPDQFGAITSSDE